MSWLLVIAAAWRSVADLVPKLFDEFRILLLHLLSKLLPTGTQHIHISRYTRQQHTNRETHILKHNNTNSRGDMFQMRCEQSVCTTKCVWDNSESWSEVRTGFFSPELLFWRQEMPDVMYIVVSLTGSDTMAIHWLNWHKASTWLTVQWLQPLGQTVPKLNSV